MSTMASAEYTEGNRNFIRSFRLLVDIGTLILKELLKKHAQQIGTIVDFLNHHSKKLQNYLQKNVIQKHQYESLYPAGGTQADVETWDISLSCLLLKLCCKLSPTEMQAIDTIKNTRNTMFCHTSNTSLDDATFIRLWTDLETEFVNVLTVIGDASFTSEVKKRIVEIKEKRIDGDTVALGSIRGQLERLISIMESGRYEQKQDDRVMNVQRHLVQAYTEYTNIRKFQIADFEAVDVDEVYIEQTIDDITPSSTSTDDHEQVRHQGSNFMQLSQLYDAYEGARHIVLVGSAGQGKTTFCLKLVSLWCSAIEKSLKSVCLTQSEHDLLNHFSILYFISIQNTIDEESVIEMITKQLFIENSNLVKDAEECFREMPDNCLVIIDGLDERLGCFSNKLPERKQLNFCRMLWTTRHSKLHLLSTLQNSQRLYIAPLNEESIRQLAQNLLKIFYRDTIPSTDENVGNFMRDLKKHKMQILAENPLILTYLVYQWCKEVGLEDSVTLNYSRVLDLLLKQIVITSNEKHQVDSSFLNMPRALAYKSNIKRNAHILRRLCPFAYDCCLNSLYVFDERSFRGIIGEEEVDIVLKSGLLSKIHASCLKPTSTESRIKFFHKTFQEFLAAIWICWKETNSQRKLHNFLKRCDTTEQILEDSLIIKFICGLDTKKARKISNHVATVALNDSDLRIYRRSLQGRYLFRSSGAVSTSYRMVKHVQNMVLECEREINVNRYCTHTRRDITTRFGVIFEMKSKEIIFPLLDIIIADKLEESTYDLLTKNANNLRSIYIDLPKAEGNDRIRDAICKSVQVERLSLDQTSSPIIYRLSPLQLQVLHSLSLSLDKIDELPEAFSQLINISALSLSISGSHTAIKQLEKNLKTLLNLKELELERVVCEDNRRRDHTCDYSIDLSNISNLKILKLEDVCSSSTKMPLSVHLEKIWLSGAASNVSSCISRLSESGSLSSIVFGDLKPFIWEEEDYKTLTSELPKWLHLEYVYLIGINFERYGIVPIFGSQRKLKYLSLEDIQLSRSGWIMLLLSLVEDMDVEDKIETEVLIITTHIDSDIMSRITENIHPLNAKRIFLDLKQEKCRDKLLGLNELRSESSV